MTAGRWDLDTKAAAETVLSDAGRGRRVSPAVTGIVRCDLSAHVDGHGHLGAAARTAAWQVLAACPAGVAVEVDLGPATYVCMEVVRTVADAAAGARSVHVVGGNAESVGRVVGQLRRELSATA